MLTCGNIDESLLLADEGRRRLVDAGVADAVSVLPNLANNVGIALVGTGIVPLATGLADSLRKDIVVAGECVQIEGLINGTRPSQLCLLSWQAGNVPIISA